MPEEPQSVVVTLTNAERTSSSRVRAKSLESLRCVADDHFHVSMREPGVSFFEDSDGTVIEDDDYLLHLEPDSVVMVCQADEKWQPEFKLADWCKKQSVGAVAESACIDGPGKNFGSDKDSEDEKTSKEDQEKYSALIQRLKAARHAQKKGEDTVDGKEANIPLDDIALLCQVDVEKFAEHMGMDKESADCVQQRLQLRLTELQKEDDLQQLEKLVKQLQEKKKESSFQTSSTNSPSPEKRKPPEDDSTSGKRTCT